MAPSPLDPLQTTLSLLQHASLSPDEVLLLAYVAVHAGPDGTASATLEAIARDVGSSAPRLKRSAHTLEASGLLTIKPCPVALAPGPQRPKRYRLQLPALRARVPSGPAPLPPAFPFEPWPQQPKDEAYQRLVAGFRAGGHGVVSPELTSTSMWLGTILLAHALETEPQGDFCSSVADLAYEASTETLTWMSLLQLQACGLLVVLPGTEKGPLFRLNLNLIERMAERGHRADAAREASERERLRRLGIKPQA